MKSGTFAGARTFLSAAITPLEADLRQHPTLWGVWGLLRTGKSARREGAAPKGVSNKGENGFTLIELVIGAALMSLILVSAYMCLHAALASQKLIEPRVEVLQTARVAMALMTADLRSACPLSSDFDFLGTHRMQGDTEADSLDFATHNYTPRRAREGDFCEVSLFMDKDPASGQFSLWRRRNPRIALDPLSGGSREEIARGVAGLKFEYSDGLDWYDTWGDSDRRGKAQFSLRVRSNLSGMPEAVRITLWLNPNARQKQPDAQESSTNEPPLVFQTVARLNLADSSQTAPASSTNSVSDTSTQNQAPGQAPGGAP
jgi:prepilin-type N-terminal cleavage/methylation domain-containing protein